MRLRHIVAHCFVLFLACAGALSAGEANAQIRQDEIRLLEPISGGNTIPIGQGAATFIDYFNRAAGWLLAVAVGFCVIWVLVGGIEMMVSGSNAGLRERGMTHLKWSIGGLVILLFAGFILRTLNSMFFQ